MLQRGDTFGSYRIVARLKAGGMAQLYLARRDGAAGFSRPVALKVIHAHLARQPEFMRMFVDEATLSAKIHDPNVVHVEDLGNVGGTLFLAMEYVHGTSLANMIKAADRADRRLAPAFVAHVGAQIASGLHAAHETTDEGGKPLGIVHRDVSPQNILLAYKGHVKLIDFGVAKAYGKQHETSAGAIQGKVGYMPPEQALSEDIDRRADVYALGIVLWEMLAGKRLFDAENELALIERVRNPVIDRPSLHAEAIPPALEAAVMRMLAVRPDDRPETAIEVKKMLLDAVPEARALEAEEVAALLRALLADEIEQQNKLLATLEAQVGYTEESRGKVFEIVRTPQGRIDPYEATATATPTTERLVDPVEALHQLTLPAVVVPDGLGAARAIPPLSTPTIRSAVAPRASLGSWSFVVAGALALLIVVTAVMSLGKPRTHAQPATPASPPEAEPEPQQAPQRPPQLEPAPATPTLALEPPPAEVAAPTASVSATPSSRRVAPVPVRRPAAASGPRPKSTTSTARKPRCVFVEGVELCE